MKDKLRDIHQTDLEKFRIKKSSKLKQKEKEIIEQYKQVKAEREKTGPAPLSDLQEKFVHFYCSRYGEWSAAQCAEAAGYGKKGSYARASELLDYKKNPLVLMPATRPAPPQASSTAVSTAPVMPRMLGLWAVVMTMNSMRIVCMSVKGVTRTNFPL